MNGKVAWLLTLPCGSRVCNVRIQSVSLFSRPIMSAVSN